MEKEGERSGKDVKRLWAVTIDLEHAQHEIDIQLALGSALLTTKGYTAPETG
jgi:hypothetical protein